MTTSDPGLRRFDNKTAIITGAANGIGAATAVRLANEGCTLTLSDVDAAALASTVAEVAQVVGDDKVLGVRCDVSDETEVKALFAESIERFGRLDVLVNMAGILAAASTHEETLDQWNRIIGVNLTGCFLTCREAIPHLLETKGNIVNAASTASLSGHPWFSAYGASKGGVLMLTNSMAMEYAKQGIRVNAVAPGGVRTAMTEHVDLPEAADVSILTRMMPIGPFGEPDNVAATVAFLASDDAKFVNGEHVRVDGATLA